MAKRVGELQGLCKVVSFHGNDMILSYLPHFHSCSLTEFAGDLEEGSLLCSVQALRLYLERTKSFPLRASTLFALFSVLCDVEERCLVLLA